MSNNKLGIGSKIKHPKFGLGVICNLNNDFYKIYFSTLDEIKEIAQDFEGLEVVEKIEPAITPISIYDIENAVEKIMLKYTDQNKPLTIASKWIGGTVEIKPGDTEMQSKVIPTKTFFSKIISVREKLRVLEQNINKHDKLDEAEKIHLQQYISRAYGSLTTFNILFADKENHFKGMGAK